MGNYVAQGRVLFIIATGNRVYLEAGTVPTKGRQNFHTMELEARGRNLLQNRNPVFCDQKLPWYLN